MAVAVLSLSLSLVFSGCSKTGPEKAAPESNPDGSKQVTFYASVPESLGTKVSYQDAEGNSGPGSLKWNTGDKLAVVGFDAGGNLIGINRNFTYSGESGASSGSFTGTLAGNMQTAATYSIYFPSDVILSEDGKSASINILNQTQLKGGSPDHLGDFILLEKTGLTTVNDPAPFVFSMKNCILRIHVTNPPGDVGTLRSIMLFVETTGGVKSQTLNIAGWYLEDAWAYMSFLPSQIPDIKENGTFKLVFYGTANSYTYQKTSSLGGKTYAPGSIYTATVDMSANTTKGAAMCYTVRTTSSNQSVPLCFRVAVGDETANKTPTSAAITIDWGDGTADTVIPANTAITTSNNTHQYATAGSYIVSITSAEARSSYKQVPEIRFCYDLTNSVPVTKIDTPFLNSDQTSFANCFKGCTSLLVIPNWLFEGKTAVTSFESCFEGCTSIDFDPNTNGTVFNGTISATTFEKCFKGCTAITRLPHALLQGATSAVNFKSCFEGCTHLQPGSYLFVSLTTYLFGTEAAMHPFKTKDMNFESCFQDAGSALAASAVDYAPDLWTESHTGTWVTKNCYKNAYFYNASSTYGFTSAMATDDSDTAWGRPKNYE